MRFLAPSGPMIGLTCCLVLWGTMAGAQNPGTPEAVNQTLQLMNSEVVTLDVPPSIEIGTVVQVPVAGSIFTLELRPHSMRGPNFQVVEVDAGVETVIDPDHFVTFRGRVAEEKGSRLAGGLLADGFWAQIILDDGTHYYVEPLEGRVPGFAANQYAVYSGDDVISTGTCGVSDDEITPPSSNLLGGTGCGGDFCLTEIACDADFEFYQAHGNTTGRTQNRIEVVLNIVALQYERDVQISYRIGTILVRTSNPDPYTTTNSDDLLLELRTQWNNNHTGIVRDVVHLFTGKNIDGTIVGIAYVGQLCDLINAYGLSQSDYSSNFANTTDLTAHELGHNWDADHCTCSNPDFTMNPGITGANRFRDTGTPDSVADILAYRNSVSCLDGSVNNDECTNALVVCDGTYTGDNTYATQDGNSSCAASATLDVWYSYTPAFNGSVTIDTEGSTGLTDTVISVHEGCFDDEIACDDQGGTGNLSSLTLPVNAGQTYLIRVSGWSGTTGGFVLNIAGPTCETQVNDDCEDAIDIGPGEYYGTTESASNDADASCANSSASNDVWYRYTPRFSGTMVIDTCDSEYDTALGVYSGCPADLTTELACDDLSGPCGFRSRIELDVTSGTTYLIRVSGFNNNAGSYIFSLSGPESENDDCDFAFTIDQGVHYGTLSGATSDGVSTCGSTVDRPDVYYEFTAPYAGTFFAQTCGTHDLPGIDSGMDTVLSIHSACPATTANQIACNDDSFGTFDCITDLETGRDSAVSTSVVAGQTVLIRVSIFGTFTDPQLFQLTVGVLPENDDCASALDVSTGGTYMGTTTGATNDGDASCGSSATNPDVWYTYTAPCTGTVQVDTCGTNDLGGAGLGIDTVLSLHSACPGTAANQLACNDQNPIQCSGATTFDDSYVEANVVAGETVLIRVTSWASTPSGDFLLNVDFQPDTSMPQSLVNGEFSGGLGWCFIDESTSGSVDYSSGAAVVTGGNDGGDDRYSSVRQTFTTYDVADHVISFDWSYASVDSPGFDGAQWDLIDEVTGLSVVGGPIVLTEADGEFGSVSESFTGSGVYTLFLGTFTDDGIAGPGVSTYDDVEISCDNAIGPFMNGSFGVSSGAPWCFTDESDNGSVDFSGGNAAVTGGNDGSSGFTNSFISQTFNTAAIPQEISFSWDYSSSNSATFDGAYWDLIDEGTGLSVVLGPVTLTDVNGMSGIESAMFNGTGTYTLVLGTYSTDNVFGAATTTFDDVVIAAQGCDAVSGLSCSSAATNVTLSWTNNSAYTSIQVYRNGTLIATGPGTATSFFDPSLPAGTYNYEVVGVCPAGPAAGATCSVTIAPTLPQFRRGDCNNDGSNNIADAIHLLGNLFPTGPPNVLVCLDACDANDDDSINIADAITVLASLFGMPAVPLPAPYPGCGVDPTPGILGCATTACP